MHLLELFQMFALILTSHRYEEQGRADASRPAVEPLLSMLTATNDHTDPL